MEKNASITKATLEEAKAFINDIFSGYGLIKNRRTDKDILANPNYLGNVIKSMSSGATEIIPAVYAMAKDGLLELALFKNADIFDYTYNSRVNFTSPWGKLIDKFFISLPERTEFFDRLDATDDQKHTKPLMNVLICQAITVFLKLSSANPIMVSDEGAYPLYQMIEDSIRSSYALFAQFYQYGLLTGVGADLAFTVDASDPVDPHNYIANYAKRDPAFNADKQLDVNQMKQLVDSLSKKFKTIYFEQYDLADIADEIEIAPRRKASNKFDSLFKKDDHAVLIIRIDEQDYSRHNPAFSALLVSVFTYLRNKGYHIYSNYGFKLNNLTDASNRLSIAFFISK